MRTFLLLIMLLAISTAAYAQTPVDRLVAALDSLGSCTLNGWKMSPDLKGYRLTGDPTQADFDDSGWRTILLRERLTSDSVWMRASFTMPENILGERVSGRVRLLVSVDDYGYAWINGRGQGFFPWDGDFVLTENAQPGERFNIAIKAINTGGPLRLLRAELILEATNAMRQQIIDLALSLKTGQKLLGFDTYQTNSQLREDPGIDRSTLARDEKTGLNEVLQNAASSFNMSALASPSSEVLNAEINKLRAKLEPIGRFAKRFTLTFIANAHIDAAWLWRSLETRAVCKNTFASVLNIMNKRKDFIYSQSSAQYYDWMEKNEPGIFESIKERIREGRWEITGGMWIEPDCNLISGESWNRHLLFGKRYFREKFGEDVKVGWNPDSFGYNASMPLFYKQAGIEAFITQKIGWNDKTVFPYRLFWWESPDGSRVLTCFTFDYVNTIEDPFRLIDWQRQFEANTGLRNMVVLYGVGDHGGGPSIAMIDRIDHLRKLDIYPSIEYKTARQYLDWVRTLDLSSLPVWKDELYLEYHQGTFTTQAKMKESNRRSETLLTNAEKFSSIASLYGRKYDAPALTAAWKDVLFNQFHDILPGSSIREVYIDAAETYREATMLGEYQLDGALNAIASSIDTRSISTGTPVVVFNPLSWNRDDIVRVSLDEGDTKEYYVSDATGMPLPTQSVNIDLLHRDLLFIAHNVPAFGYAVYAIREGSPPPTSPFKTTIENNSESAGGTRSFSNDAFSVSVDMTKGTIAQVHDLRNSTSLFSGPCNELQLLEDVPKAWSAWNVGWTGVQYPSTFRCAEVIENGPVRMVVRLHRDYLKPGVVKDVPTEDFPSSFFTQDVILYNEIGRIDFHTDVDWWEENTMLKAAFPLANPDSVATFEIPYGTIQRYAMPRTKRDSAKTEVPAARWVDVTHDGYGVALLNNSKYGHDIRGNLLRLSLLRSPVWPDKTADRGKHSMDYALYPHKGGWREAMVYRRGYEFNTPLIPVRTNKHEGTLPLNYGFISVNAPNIVVTTVKRAEEGSAWVVQLLDATGSGAIAELIFPMQLKSASRVNTIEDETGKLECQGQKVVVPVRSHEVITIKVQP
jgi:alpha-mannosidase